jgi:hypothetical protein
MQDAGDSPGRGRLLALAAFVGATLAADALLRSLPAQLVLGGVTFAVLLAATRGLAPEDRHRAWMCVAIATGLELFASQLWGAYRYRLGPVPLYVPPGHGIILLMIVLLARRRLMAHRAVVGTALAAVMVWAAAGLILHPGGRSDVLGAVLLVPMLVLVRARPAFFTAAVVVTTALELAGTWLGDWAWVAVTPVVALGSGNPPAAIAGAYGLLDLAVLIAVGLLPAARGAARERAYSAAQYSSLKQHAHAQQD